MPRRGAPVRRNEARSLSLRAARRDTIAGPNAPPLPSLPWQLAQRVSNSARPELESCAAAATGIRQKMTMARIRTSQAAEKSLAGQENRIHQPPEVSGKTRGLGRWWGRH